jgi:poly [ADP-ribose] polymerase 2/3/4
VSAKSAKKETSPAKVAVKEEELKKVVMKGKAPVDQYVPGASGYEVVSDSAKTYATTLNQSNVMANNNKFYILQVLKHSTVPNNYMFFTRWGRVGVPGQQAPIICSSEGMAIQWYNKKLREKMSGGYREVEMNYEADEEPKKEEKKESVKQIGKEDEKIESTL